MDFSEIYPDTCSSVALAARKGDLSLMELLVGQGKSFSTKDNRGWMPLHEAAYWDNADCLHFITHLSIIHFIYLMCNF